LHKTISDIQLSSKQIHQRKELSTCGGQVVSAYLLLGGNMGDVPHTFQEAIRLLKETDLLVYSTSKVYQSEPWGFESSALFYNQAIEVKTDLSAHKLLQTVLSIEEQLGRTRSNADGYESRIIDIDILLYGEETVASQRLTIPHPRLTERNFALMPLAEIAAEYIHPEMNQTIAALLQQSPDSLRVWTIN